MQKTPGKERRLLIQLLFALGVCVCVCVCVCVLEKKGEIKQDRSWRWRGPLAGLHTLLGGCYPCVTSTPYSQVASLVILMSEVNLEDVIIMMPSSKLLRKWVWQDIPNYLGVMFSNKSFSSPLIFWYMSQSPLAIGEGWGWVSQKGLWWKNTPKKMTVMGLRLIRKMIWSPFSPIQVVTTMADHSPEKSEKSFSTKVLSRNYKEMLCFFSPWTFKFDLRSKAFVQICGFWDLNLSFLFHYF